MASALPRIDRANRRVRSLLRELKKADPDAYRYYSESELLENMAGEIYRINECLKPQSYNEAAYTPEKMAFVEGVRDRVETMAESYLGLSREEAGSGRDAHHHPLGRPERTLPFCFHAERAPVDDPERRLLRRGHLHV